MGIWGYSPGLLGLWVETWVASIRVVLVPTSSSVGCCCACVVSILDCPCLFLFIHWICQCVEEKRLKFLASSRAVEREREKVLSVNAQLNKVLSIQFSYLFLLVTLSQTHHHDGKKHATHQHHTLDKNQLWLLLQTMYVCIQKYLKCMLSLTIIKKNGTFICKHGLQSKIPVSFKQLQSTTTNYQLQYACQFHTTSTCTGKVSIDD